MFTPTKPERVTSAEEKVNDVGEHDTKNSTEFTFIKSNKGKLEFPTIYKSRPGRDRNYYQGVVSLYTEDNELLKFRVFRDTDLGIPERVQEIIHHSKNDDDRRTTSTQLSRSREYTIEDLRKGMVLNYPESTYSQKLECLSSCDSLTTTPSQK